MPNSFTSAAARASYGVGRQLGDQLAAHPFDGLDPEAVAAGVRDTLLGVESAVAAADLEAAFREISAQIQAKQREQSRELAAAGEQFLAENATREEVTVLASGLQYQVLATGEGDKPGLSSTVQTHYHGTLIDGTVFDSSVERGQPAEFPVSGVIAGWTEALQLMNVGAKWRLYVPYNLAYGERGAGGAIGPYQALIFDVELLAIV